MWSAPSPHLQIGTSKLSWEPHQFRGSSETASLPRLACRARSSDTAGATNLPPPPPAVPVSIRGLRALMLPWPLGAHKKVADTPCCFSHFVIAVVSPHKLIPHVPAPEICWLWSAIRTQGTSLEGSSWDPRTVRVRTLPHTGSSVSPRLGVVYIACGAHGLWVRLPSV